MNIRSFDDAKAVKTPTPLDWQFDVRATDYELSALGQDLDAGGCVERVLVEASRTLLVILALFAVAWIVWH